jgi:C-terminal processing protease CtpA/Prc
MKNWLYNEWEDVNRALVDKLGKGKILYTHMRDMVDGELNEFLKDMHTRIIGKEAIILDLRYNNGGNVHKEVLDFLAQKAHYHWGYRNFAKNAHPNVTPGDMPVIALVNERSLSDAEVTSNGIQTLGLATIIGTETYRWIIFTTGTRMLDGSLVRLPAWGCNSLDGKDLEATGVKPDIYVKNTFEDRVKGRDPQLERAVEEALKQLKQK